MYIRRKYSWKKI